ncbi:hypothetical protein C8F01DRAFT_1261731 [Mycena amicta]|nr:hypothetical protein C8F01DRAFT_1261731 [Mycena amicta]
MSILCLACSSSLLKGDNAFTTPCCQRPICASCVAGNPRLTRYNPCLACLGGIAVVGNYRTQNIDGAVRDDDTFVVGDDDDDNSNEDEPNAELSPESYPVERPAPDKYYIKRADTLQGIALRFKVDGRLLCQLNNLPPSTLNTTPHLLHTRTFLVIPPSAHTHLQPCETRPNSDEERAREVRRIRERAEKRLQTLTKEVDWRVAKAYITLVADDPASADEFALKQKELGATSSSTTLEAMAADQYLDDLEWEAEQLRLGRTPQILPYPPKKQS